MTLPALAHTSVRYLLRNRLGLRVFRAVAPLVMACIPLGASPLGGMIAALIVLRLGSRLNAGSESRTAWSSELKERGPQARKELDRLIRSGSKAPSSWLTHEAGPLIGCGGMLSNVVRGDVREKRKGRRGSATLR